MTLNLFYRESSYRWTRRFRHARQALGLWVHAHYVVVRSFHWHMAKLWALCPSLREAYRLAAHGEVSPAMREADAIYQMIRARRSVAPLPGIAVTEAPDRAPEERRPFITSLRASGRSPVREIKEREPFDGPPPSVWH